VETWDKSLIDSIFFITPTMPTDAEVPSDILTHSSDDWEHDPANPRQWSQAKKWQAMTIVRNSLLSVFCLTVLFP
jgi:hypothetical protein